MTDLIWIGNTLYPRWFVIAAFVLASLTMFGLSHVSRMLIRYLQQRDGKNL
jgi:small neutral amino acid transporter SnatA (MarC family)